MSNGFEHMRVKANGIIFHVAAIGPQDAPPILFLHGFPESWVSWRPIMERLKDRYRMYAPDLRGYGGTERPQRGYDILTLTDDVRELLDVLALRNPVLVGHDWGGALAWVAAHRFSDRLRKLAVVNCTHPLTLRRAILRGEGLQTLRSWYMGFFQTPRIPERLLTARGGALLRRSFKAMEGRPGAMDPALVDEVVRGFRGPEDMRGPINYYREAGRTQLDPSRRAELEAALRTPITIPTTLIWGEADRALALSVARKSESDARCPVDWRPLPGVGHFVSMEAPEALAQEIDRVARPEQTTTASAGNGVRV